MADEITQRTADLEQGLDALQNRSSPPSALASSAQAQPQGTVTGLEPQQPPEVRGQNGGPPGWNSIEGHPAFAQMSPEQKLVTFDRWHNDAYNYASMQDSWKGKDDPFNQRAADVQQRLSKDANGLTPDQARLKIADQHLAATKAQLGTDNLTDEQQSQALNQLHPDIADAWHTSPKQGMVMATLNALGQEARSAIGHVVAGGEALGAFAYNNPLWDIGLGEKSEPLSANDIMESLKNSKEFQWARSLSDPDNQQKAAYVDPRREQNWLVKRTREAGSFLPAATGPLAPVIFGASALGEHMTDEYHGLIKQGVDPEQAADTAMSNGLKSGGVQSLVFAALPPVFRNYADKWLIDKFGSAGLSRFLAGRLAGVSEGAAVGAASRMGENAASDQPLTKDVGKSASGLALWNLVLPHGESAKEQQMRKDILDAYKDFGPKIEKEIKDALRERAGLPERDTAADQTRDQKIAKATEDFQKAVQKAVPGAKIPPAPAPAAKPIEEPKPQAEAAAPAPAEAAAEPAEVTAPAVEQPTVAAEPAAEPAKPAEVTAPAVETAAKEAEQQGDVESAKAIREEPTTAAAAPEGEEAPKIGLALHTVNGEEQVKLDVQKEASVDDLMKFMAEIGPQLDPKDLAVVQRQVENEIRERQNGGKTAEATPEQNATIDLATKAGLENVAADPITGMIAARGPDGGNLTFPAGATADEIEKFADLKSRSTTAAENGDTGARAEAEKEYGKMVREVMARGKAKAATTEPTPATETEATPATGLPTNMTEKAATAAQKLIADGRITEEDLQKRLTDREPLQGKQFSANDIRKIEKELREGAKAPKTSETETAKPETKAEEVPTGMTKQITDHALKIGAAPREADLVDKAGLSRSEAKSLLGKIGAALKKAFPPEPLPEGARKNASEDKARTARLDELQEEIKATEAAYERASKAFRDNPKDTDATDRAGALQAELEELKARFKTLRSTHIDGGETITLADGTTRPLWTNDPHKTARQMTKEGAVRIPADMVDKVNPAIHFTIDPETGEGIVNSVRTRYVDEFGDPVRVSSALEFQQIEDMSRNHGRINLVLSDPSLLEAVSDVGTEAGFTPDESTTELDPHDDEFHQSPGNPVDNADAAKENYAKAKQLGFKRTGTQMNLVLDKIIANHLNELSPFDQLMMLVLKSRGTDFSRLFVELVDRPDEGWAGKQGSGADDRREGILMFNMAVDHASGFLATIAHELEHQVTKAKLLNPRPGAEAAAAKDWMDYHRYIVKEMGKRVFGKELSAAEIKAWQNAYKGIEPPKGMEWIKDGVRRANYIVSDPAEVVALGNNRGVQMLVSQIAPEPTIGFRGVLGNVRTALEQGFQIIKNLFFPTGLQETSKNNALIQGLGLMDRVVRIPDETSMAGRRELAAMGYGIGARSGQPIKLRTVAEGMTPDQAMDFNQDLAAGTPNPEKPEDQQVRITTRFTGGKMTHEMKIGENAGAAEILKSLDSLNENKRIPEAEKNAMREQLTQSLRDKVEKGTLTGPRNDLIDQSRRERGLAPRMDALRRAQPAVWDEAMQKLDVDPNAGSKLVSDINRGRTTHIADTDVALLAHEQVVRENDFDQAIDDINKAGKDQSALSDARARRDQARRDLSDIYDAISRTGTMTAQSLAMRKILLNTDLTLARMEAMMKAARNGEDLKPDEAKALEQTYNRMKDLKKNQDIIMDYLTTTGRVADLDKAAKGDAKAQARIEADAQTQLRDKKAQDKYRKTLLTKMATLEEKLKSGDLTKATREKKDLPKELQSLQIEYKRLRQEFDKKVQTEELRNRPYVKWVEQATGKLARWVTDKEDIGGVRVSADRALEQIADWVRAGVISSPVAMGKLISAAAIRLGLTPTEQGVGAVLGRLPLISQIAAKAPREGLSGGIATEGQAFAAAIRKIGEDMKQIAQTGQSDLDILYGKGQVRPRGPALEAIGRLHYLAKALPFRVEFERSSQILTDFYEKQSPGITTDPMVKTQIALDAYKQAEKAIFKQNNRLVSAYKSALGRLTQPDKVTGKAPLLSKAFSTALQTELPVVGVPTNIAAEAAHYIFGSVTGSWKMANAFRNGIESLRPEEADAIMNHLKKGSIGAAAMLLAFFAPNVITGGGFYVPGQKRDPKDMKAEDVKIGGVTIDHRWVHAPLVLAMQFASSIRRQYDKHVTPNAKDRNAATALGAAVFGLADAIPMAKAVQDAGKLFDPKQRPHFFAEMAKTDLIPQAVQWEAKREDVDSKGKPIERKPDFSQGPMKGIKQTIETGIPSLGGTIPFSRPSVPRKPPG